MVFIPVSYSILVIISDLAATAKRAGRAEDGEDGPMAERESRGKAGAGRRCGTRAEREGRCGGRWRRAEAEGFDGVREKDYICVLALKRV